jgi:hypothetical protein
MQSKKKDILSDKQKHKEQALMMLAIFCRNHRMLDINLRALPKDAIEDIGNEVVDLFVDRVQQYEKQTPPNSGAQSNGWGMGNRARSRS